MATSRVACTVSSTLLVTSSPRLVLAKRDLPLVLRAAVPPALANGMVFGVADVALGNMVAGDEGLGEDLAAIMMRGLLRATAGVDVRVCTLWRRPDAGVVLSTAWVPMAHSANAIVLSAATWTAGVPAACAWSAIVASPTPSGVPCTGVLKRTDLRLAAARGDGAALGEATASGRRPCRIRCSSVGSATNPVCTGALLVALGTTVRGALLSAGNAGGGGGGAGTALEATTLSSTVGKGMVWSSKPSQHSGSWNKTQRV